MTELHEEVHDDLRYFSMSSITVDGITSFRNKDYGVNFFTMKYDFKGEVPREDQDGYCNLIHFDEPHIPNPYANGEIDEEVWIKTGIIIGVDDKDYQKVRADIMTYDW